MSKQLTPMLRQYFDIKNNHQDSILFFRLGDFYEMFGDDAVEASSILDITLTARNKGTENEIPMCGIPHHAAETYMAKLTKAGKKVAICEQVSEPSEKGIVERAVVKIVTPGTTLDDTVSNSKTNNYIVSLIYKKGTYGLALLDLSTGEFKTCDVKEQKTLQEIFFLLSPSEILIPEMGEEFRIINLDTHSLFQLPYYEEPAEYLKRHFTVTTLSGFGLSENLIGIEAAASLLCYIKETQKTKLQHITKISSYNYNSTMLLDETTIRNLEIFSTSRTSEIKGSLVHVLDTCITSMGSRKLRNWISYPLLHKEKIDERLNMVAALLEKNTYEPIRSELKNCRDVERIVARVGCGQANALHLKALQESIAIAPQLKKMIENQEDLEILSSHLHELPELTNLLSSTLVDEPASITTAGGMIRQGVSSQLDELTRLSTNGKDWIKNYQISERERTGIKSLKVKFNKVFGYYIEVSNANKHQAPEHYIRKQTLVNAERFITPQLKEYEEKVLTAQQQIIEIEQQLFEDLLVKVSTYIPQLQELSMAISQLDVLSAFSFIAMQNNYCRPEMSIEKGLYIKEGRHPVIETILKQEKSEYIPNSTKMNHESEMIILTGPNMSGKSSYLRQTALITLMAQMGSFVPAASATIGIVDRIFTRVGASDDLSKGQSTFMVEMVEAANIINNATEKSLIIFDELGRGTSTFDGVSIAWAILEYLAENIRALTLFATHYTELIEVAKDIPHAKNYSVAVSEKDGDIVFLRKIVDGGIDKSYGIEVAKLAGLPLSIIKRSKQVLGELESERHEEEEHLMGNQTTFIQQSPHHHHEALRQLRKTDLEYTTPIEALMLLYKLKKKCSE